MERCAFFSTSNTHSLWKRSLKKVSNLLEEYGIWSFWILLSFRSPYDLINDKIGTKCACFILVVRFFWITIFTRKIFSSGVWFFPLDVIAGVVWLCKQDYWLLISTMSSQQTLIPKQNLRCWKSWSLFGVIFQAPMQWTSITAITVVQSCREFCQRDDTEVDLSADLYSSILQWMNLTMLCDRVFSPEVLWY